MRHIPVAIFKDKASEFLQAAENGEEIVVTRHGKPSVRLSSAVDKHDQAVRAGAAIDSLLEHRARMRAQGRATSIEELIAWKNEGQR